MSQATYDEPGVRALDRARELANIGAGHAAGALSRLVNRAIWIEVPRAQALDAGAAPFSAQAAEDGAAVFFELTGGVGGLVAVVFSRASLEVIVTEMMGAQAYDIESAVESAVREAGNMLVSHYASAIADTLGTLVLPSVPMLTEQAGPGALASLVSWRPGDAPRLILESRLFDPAHDVEGWLTLVLE
jgi:chemotaxis protein CheC